MGSSNGIPWTRRLINNRNLDLTLLEAQVHGQGASCLLAVPSPGGMCKGAFQVFLRVPITFSRALPSGSNHLPKAPPPHPIPWRGSGGESGSQYVNLGAHKSARLQQGARRGLPLPFSPLRWRNPVLTPASRTPSPGLREPTQLLGDLVPITGLTQRGFVSLSRPDVPRGVTVSLSAVAGAPATKPGACRGDQGRPPAAQNSPCSGRKARSTQRSPCGQMQPHLPAGPRGTKGNPAGTRGRSLLGGDGGRCG